MRKRHTLAVIVLAFTTAAVGAFYLYGRGVWAPPLQQLRKPRSIADVVARYGPEARARLEPHFRRAGVAWPPRRIALLVFKDEERVSLWADSGAGWRFIRRYPVTAASGHAGPKLREGDRQVPEGIYRIEHLNPNSSYHLSMKVSYPNELDRRMAARDGRTQLGGDIFIHGKSVSIGCVAVGDRAIEELFTLVAETGHRNVKVVIAPNDLRARGAILHEDAPAWVGELYRAVRTALRDFPLAREAR